MRGILIALILYAVYSVAKTFQSAQALSMKVTGLIPTLTQGKLLLTLKTQIINKFDPVTLNSFIGEVLLNGIKIGLINYSNNDIIQSGTTDILIPVELDAISDISNIIQILSAQGIKEVAVNGKVTIDSIELPYDNEILNLTNL